MADIYEENIKYLNLEQLKSIKHSSFKRDLNILKARTGVITLQVNVIDSNKKVFLHSKYDPRKEAERFAFNSNTDASVLLLIGFGLGYHVEELLNRMTGEQKLIVIIVNVDIFKTALQQRNLQKVLMDKRIELIFESNTAILVQKMKQLFDSLDNEDLELIVYDQAVRIIPEELLFLKDILEEIKVSRFNNQRLGSKIKDNILKNASKINESIGVNNFINIFKDVPIFIISAGPSLDKNIDLLKNIGDQGVIIVVDTAFPLLIKRGIKPDFLVSNEPIDLVYKRVFKDNLDYKTPLLHTLGSSCEVINNYQGPKIIGLAKQDLLMDKLVEIIDKGRIQTGGTVALPALDFAHLMGGDPIIFVGQDFAFSAEGITHASDTLYGKSKKNTKALRKVKGINEDYVYTNTSYYLYLRSFEKYIRNNNATAYFDATEGGARIQGTRVETLENAIESYCNIEINKSEIINDIIKNSNDKKVSLKELEIFLKNELY